MNTDLLNSKTITPIIDRATGRWGPLVLRWTAALLWLGNISWKRPPDFGRSGSSCEALCGYTRAGIDHPVLPGAPWLFEHVIGAHLQVFGWITIISEGTLAILLMSGRYRRSAAVLGIVQSFAIMAAVANSPGEWYWSYLLMIALHIAVLTTAPGARTQSARVMAAVTVGFGVVMALVHSGEGFTGTGFSVFAGNRGLPDDLAKNLFGGSVALGLIIAAVGAAGIAVATLLDVAQQRIVGIALAVVGAVLFLTYGSDGLIIRLGSTTTTACVAIALGLALAIQPPRPVAVAPT
jgi:thiosulfate dehydrogenase [quinone] large subunit